MKRKIQSLNQKKSFIPLVFIMILLINCGRVVNSPETVALWTDDPSEGISALSEITDQLVISRIAKQARCPKVQLEAVRKLTNQDTIAEIAIQTSNPQVALKAIYLLTNDSLLGKIATESQNSDLQMAAFKRVNDPCVLAKLALETHQGINAWAFQKLAEPIMLEKMANIKNDKRVILINEFIHAFDNIPESTRLRFMHLVYPALHVLIEPEVVNELGEIVVIKTSWKAVSKNYKESDWSSGKEKFTGKFKTRPGEEFSCLIRLKKMNSPLSHTWASDFPELTSDFNFLPAHVDVKDLLKPVFKLFPQSYLEEKMGQTVIMPS
jgi:hypothetical protein